ncbi:hypothetical protein [Nocardioides coralli]|uniref:hypothetical protein n=1 Tax=Nocardioides coralli TaxID=2872154 RepID=UPI001CA41AE0|nr:hypothetical protein [Nocardioides coralli]QZY29707.1 hypothetical protein K6T13_03160 [Nocardioides coralli]
MGTRKDYRGPAEAFDKYDAAIALVDGVTRKGAANPYTSGNGWMATYLGKEGEVAIRLGTDDLEAFLSEHGTERPVSYGSVMKDFAIVPEPIVADAEQLAPLIRRAHDHVSSLPPK